MTFTNFQYENDLNFGTISPPTAPAKDNATYLVTDTGDANGVVSEMWKYDAQAAKWVQIQTGASCTTRFITEVIPSATSGQTVFPLSHYPVDHVSFSRNGAPRVASVSANTAVYDPADNGGFAMLAGDEVIISYGWVDCTTAAAGELDGTVIVTSIISNPAARDMFIHPAASNSLRWELDGAVSKLYENDGTLPGSV